jgi:hypothetical protein
VETAGGCVNLGELIVSARRKAFDLADPGKIPREEWIEYANEGEVEACRRARLLVDSTTPELCQLDIVSGVATYDLDPRIIFVRRVKLASKSLSTPKIGYRQLDEQAPGWETSTGDIEAYCLDYQHGSLRFYREPVAVDTATLTTIRAPLAPMELNADEPDVPERYHIGIVHWMLHKWYLNDDPEIGDDKLADKYLALFTNEFGVKSSAIEETWITDQHGYNLDEGLF